VGIDKIFPESRIRTIISAIGASLEQTRIHMRRRNSS
jgi:hypothetical protein